MDKNIDTTQVNPNIGLYIPNVINYGRIIVALIMIYNIRTRPFLAFICCLLSGLLDSFDGDVARLLNQTSKLGYLLDVSIDRLTNSAQLFILASLYPKLSIYFYSVMSAEMVKDFSSMVANNFRLEIDLLKPQMNCNNAAIKMQNETTSTIVSNSESDAYNFLLIQFYHYVWYSSDLFYWLLYFKAFINKDSMMEVQNEANDSLVIDLNNNVLKSQVEYVGGQKRGFLKELRICFDSLSDFLRFHLSDKMRPYLESGNLLNSLNRRFCCNFKFLFRVFGYFCFLGAFLKFYLNFRSLLFTFFDIVYLDQLKISILNYKK